jgi:hypothetical protein
MTHHLKRGEYFGYPSCCIDWFIANRTGDEITELTPQQEQVHGGTGFIPCPTCAKHVTRKTLPTLLRNRICRSRFPYGYNKNVFMFYRLLRASTTALKSVLPNQFEHFNNP